MSNTIAVYNFKGGVGKTSTTLSLAYSWSRAFKVLVIDCDPQANLTQAFTDQDHSETLFTITKKLLHNDQPKIEPLEIHPYLHLIPGDFHMTSMESNTEFISFGHIIFYKLLSSIRHDYDLILLDCPTHFGITVKSFIANINSILIPSTPGSFSVSGFKKLLQYLSEVKKDKPLEIIGIFFNQYRKNTLFHQRIVREAEQELGDLILDQRIRESIRVSEANEQNESVYSFTDESAVAEDFLKLSEEIIERMNRVNLDEALNLIKGEKVKG
ncbi:chromosome partitioning protein [Ekhidna lutea]|uniref:Chromosome partitioning protein n=1 Tax=Ekhidna lutea TaxID=447679 RepID=A0A239K0M6_EKHLU|nr:ParA family protein [Ekhidna lutea]SNT11262.1 chromosome partitioning protein [Ekhidna lutea]